MCSCSYDFVLLRAVSSNPPPPPRPLPVASKARSSRYPRPRYSCVATKRRRGRMLVTRNVSVQLLFSSDERVEFSSAIIGPANDSIRARVTHRRTMCAHRFGSSNSGFPGTPLLRISKYNIGEPCGSVPIVAMRCPIETTSSSFTLTLCVCP